MKVTIKDSEKIRGKKIGKILLWGLSLSERKKILIRKAGGFISAKGKIIRTDYLYDPATFSLVNPLASVVFKIKSVEDLKKAEEWIFNSVDKNRAPELNIGLNQLNRPVGKRLLRMLAKDSRVTPTMITFVGIVLFLIGCLFLIPGGTSALFGVTLIQLAHSLDCVDGRLARLRLSTSTLGEYLDNFGDSLKLGSVYVAMTISSYLGSRNELFLGLGLLTLFGEYLNGAQIMINQKIQVSGEKDATVAAKKWSPLTPYLWIRTFLSYYENRLLIISVAAVGGVLPYLLAGFAVVFNLFWLGGILFMVLNRKHVVSYSQK